MYIIADLAKEENWQLIIDETVRQFGAIHCLVNNAATTMRCTLEELTPEKYIYINTVNVMAPTFLAQAAVKYFRLQGTGGSILNIGSINAYCGEDKLLPYAMSKGAMATMTTTLSDALWRDRIRVNQLNLDWVATENEINLKIREGFPSDWYKHVPPHMAPSGEILHPNDIAEIAMVYLSSNKLSGAVVPVGQLPMTVRLNGNQSSFFQDITSKRTKVILNKIPVFTTRTTEAPENPRSRL